MNIWNTTFDWIVMVSGVLFLVKIIAIGFQVARQPQISARRRKALLSGCLFLSLCLALASIVFLVHGPLHFAPSLLALALVSPVIVVGLTMLGGWVRALRQPGLK